MHIRSALISVYHKEGLEEIIPLLKEQKIKVFSTGGTYDYLLEQGLKAEKIEDLTGYPSILGGRVKTLHPKVFGGILARRLETSDVEQMEAYGITGIDLVVVDLYPFSETVASEASDADIIEKIDIGGVSLIRAAAKNFRSVVVIPSKAQYPILLKFLRDSNGDTTQSQRQALAREAFSLTSRYDAEISAFFSRKGKSQDNKNPDQHATLSAPDSLSQLPSAPLRYGENPHQQAAFLGSLEDVFTKLNGKELSYNNLLDIDAAVEIMGDLQETAFVVIKHNNPCGVAIEKSTLEAWKKAYAADPVSAFGGILITNGNLDTETAQQINEIFFEVLIAPSYSDEALTILKGKKNRIILQLNQQPRQSQKLRSVLNGYLLQQADLGVAESSGWKTVTKKKASGREIEDLALAYIIVKHAKSNAITLVKDGILIGIGMGQTSRVDALEQALEKARKFEFDLQGAVLASDAFFPFPDCVNIAAEAGITAIVQPGGSIKDQDSIDAADRHGLRMLFSGRRHFKH